MGEFDLLRKVRERLPPAGPRLWLGSGDDAAVTLPGGATATSVDALVEGVHFRRKWSSLGQIGRKALAVALSDLAAMGAQPGEAYVVLGVPADLDEDGCLELIDGMVEVAVATGTSLAGGDVSRAPVLALAMTVVGHAPEPKLFVGRGGARPGDVLVLTGEIGGAATGLLLLESQTEARSPFESDSHQNSERARLLGRQLEPVARLGAGLALAAAGASAAIDVSDGLGGDAGHLAAASGVALRIDAAALPIAVGVAEVAGAAGFDPLELAVSGGEDYELLAALPPERFEAAAAAVEAEGVALTLIGEVLEGEGAEVRLPDGGLLKTAGFDQLH